MKKVKIIVAILIILTFLLFGYFIYKHSETYLEKQLQNYIKENKSNLKYLDNRIYIKTLIEEKYLNKNFGILGKGKINLDISYFIVERYGANVLEKNICYLEKKYNKSSEDKLYDSVLIDNKIVKENDGLYKENDKYIFKGNDVNNYVWYNGIMYRIISVSEDGIKLITDKPVTSIHYSDSSNEWESSYVRNWLNKEVFISAINKFDLLEMNLCTGKTSGIKTKNIVLGQSKTNITEVTDYKEYSECNKISKDYIGLISFSEYMDANTKNSNYLYQKNNFYTITPDSNNGLWYSYWGYSSYLLESNNLENAMAVRPVITLKKDIDVKYGNGTKENYYIVGDTLNNGTLKDKIVGSYFIYSGYLWRIIAQDEGVTKAKLTSTLDRKTFYIYKGQDVSKDCYGMDFEIEKSYKECTNIFNENKINLPLYIEDKYHAGGNNIATYLNNKEDKDSFYNTLDNKNWIVSSDWDISYYYKNNNLYTEKKYVNLNIGMPRPGEMFSSNDDGIYYYTIAPSKSENNNLIYYIDFTGELKEGLVTNPFGIRPVVKLKNNLNITRGKGLPDDPYYLET